MKCPNCLGHDRLYRVPSELPWYLFPLRLFFVRIHCDCCLISFYRFRPYHRLLEALNRRNKNERCAGRATSRRGTGYWSSSKPTDEITSSEKQRAKTLSQGQVGCRS